MRIRSVLLIAVTFLIMSCNSTISKSDNNSQKQLPNFDWLLGKWERLHEETGKETFENWEKVNTTEYAGINYTMENTDTVKQEKMRIVKRDGKWILTVKTPEETEATIFPITILKNDEFICTNDSLDFPKQIKYWKNGERMNALVSNESFKIDFEFERLR